MQHHQRQSYSAVLGSREAQDPVSKGPQPESSVSGTRQVGAALSVVRGKPKNVPNLPSTTRQAVIFMTAKEGKDFVDTYKAVRERTTADQHVMRAYRSGERKMSLVLKPEADGELVLAD